MQKVCPIVYRSHSGDAEVLASFHPSAGKQFVKGTIEPSETPLAATKRELWEESGLTAQSPMALLGQCEIGPSRQLWHFFGCQAVGLPDTWQHLTADDHGHTFAFFWHPIFREAFNFFAPRLPP
ncbi:hypothetical protein GFPCMMHI_01138 [Ensifer adhaerens]|nr:hypothetical protein [Ensifer adhaerens]